MEIAKACPDCGGRPTAGAPAGLCPRCLLRLGLGAGLFDDPRSNPAGRSGVRARPGGPRLAGDGGDASGVRGLSAGPDRSPVPVPRLMLRDTTPDARVVRPGSDEMPDLSGYPTRYQLVGEVARGGMGAVFKGRDVDLGRDLAIKVILEEHQGCPEMARRFAEEAQIGGQLQHPGIVPVHELGRFPDGRLYIAMTLVRGQTLASLLGARKGPGDDRPRLLSVFEQVCQAVAYAHSRGVVHRDLKPSNVMVGAFGEVQVMDWGLAKVLDQGGVADERRASREQAGRDAVRTAGAGESLAGSVIGTPAYMAPEQARGELDTVDERADVFGLGSILCEILTGRPAYAGRAGAELCRMAERADLRDAFGRLEAGGGGDDADLVALARSCLAAAPRDRPRDAGAVVAALAAYTAGVERRIREAELAKARAETIAVEERKRRGLAVALAATVIATGLLVAGGWAWAGRESWNRLREARDAVDRALDTSAALREKALAAKGDAPTLWIQAIEAARRAELLVPASGDLGGLRTRVRTVLASLERERAEAEAGERDRRTVDRLAEIHNDLGVHGDVGRADAEYAAAFRGYGVDVDADAPDVAGARLAASPAAAELANALDQWVFIRRLPQRRDAAGALRLVAVAKVADPDPWRNRLRDTLGVMVADRGRALEDLEQLGATADVDRLPEASVTRLAHALSSLGRGGTAAALLRRAQRVYPGDFWLNADLGREMLDAGLPDEAVRFYAVAVGIRPGSVMALGFLGRALLQAGRLDESAETFRRRTSLRPDDAHAHVMLGTALLRAGRARAADSEFAEARRLKPADWTIRDLIGSARAEAGEWGAAVRERREAVGLDPSVPHTHNALGFALLGSGRPSDAAAAFREAARIDPGFQPAHVGLGRALLAVGDFSGARDVAGRSAGATFGGHGLDPEPVAIQADRMLSLEARLPPLLRGEARPDDPDQAAAFAQLCLARGDYDASVRFWIDAFRGRPALADERDGEMRLQAARAAARSGVDAESRARGRELALGWLTEEFAAARRVHRRGKPREWAEIPKRLGRWQADPALASVREPAAGGGASDEELLRIRALWDAVDDLRRTPPEAGADVPSRP